MRQSLTLTLLFSILVSLILGLLTVPRALSVSPITQFQQVMVGETKVLLRAAPEYGDSASIFAVMLAGHRHQWEGEIHCAHVAEHMVLVNPADTPDRESLMVWVSKTFPKSQLPCNGWTGSDHTQFEMTLPAEQIPEALTRLINGLFPNQIDDSTLKKEPETRLEPELECMTTAFPAAPLNQFFMHLFRGTPGSEDIFRTSVMGITADRVQRFMDREYSASRLILVIVGNFDEIAILAVLEEALQGVRFDPRPCSANLAIEPEPLAWSTCEQAPNPISMIAAGVNGVTEADAPLVCMLLQIAFSRLMELDFPGFVPSLDLSGTLYQAGIPYLLLTHNAAVKADKETLEKGSLEIVQNLKDVLSHLAVLGPLVHEVAALLPANGEMDQDHPQHLHKSLYDAFLRGILETPSGLVDLGNLPYSTEEDIKTALTWIAVQYLPNIKYTRLLVNPVER